MLTKGFKRKGKWRWLVFLIAILCIGMLAGCNTGDDEDEDGDDTAGGGWTTISVYYYRYDEDDRLIREINDNNANGSSIDGVDVTWVFNYDEDGRRSGYFRYEGADTEPDGVGTYFYNLNGCNDRLEEETPQGTNLQVWIYDDNPDCTWNSYHYEGNDTEEDGTYIRDLDGYVVKLELDSGAYWEYTLDDSGDRLRYDFYDADGALIQYGVYIYDEAGNLAQLENFERL